jgi:hypothetical protein
MLRCSIHNSWDNYLSLLPSNKFDIYFTEAYLHLNKNEGIPECFVCQERENIWLFPYIKKQIVFNDFIYWDFESQYGYGGPISNCDDCTFLQQVQIEFCKFMKNNGFIAGLIRFHPLLNNQLLLKDCATLFFNRNTVGVDLSQDIDTIWHEQIHTKHRNSIRKAEKSGLKYFVDFEFKHYNEFKQLYVKTMEKNHADKFYFFDNTYFETFKNTFKENSFLGHVVFEDTIISSSMFFFSKDYAHYHLSGSNEDFLTLNPNSLLIFKTIEYFKNMNKKILHLGGGSDQSVENSLYRFKARFSNKQYDFYMGEIIFNPDLYDKICKNWAEADSDKVIINHNKLLKYRY